MSSDSPAVVLYDGNGNAITVTSGKLGTTNTDSAGQVQYNFPAGFVRTTDEPRQLFYDPFDSALDTTNRWIAPTISGGGVAASTTTGVMTLGSGTTASGYSYLQSKANFVPTIPGWLGYSFAIKIEFAVVTNATRYWGSGTSPGSPATSTSITDGAGFEIFTDGKLYAVVYIGGTRTVIQDLSASGTNTQPLDANYHRYIIYYRTDKIYYYIDSLATPVATANFTGPQVQTLPIKLSAVAGATPPGSSCVITCTGLAVWDTAKNTTGISDGTYPWRKLQIDSNGNAQSKFVSATSTVTSVASSASNVNLLALNTARLGATIFNDSTVILYIKMGTTASLTNYSVQVQASGYFEIPYGYTGNIDGIWASANGNARISELT